MTSFRLATGGQIDRSRPLTFHFDGRSYEGYLGDTLASALLANGVLLTGRSFKYHRPRGLFATGVEEPNSLVTVHTPDWVQANTLATVCELHDGFRATSQNRWPSLRFDLMAVNNVISPLISAGFYYKTFMWPRKGWMFYEKFIRRAAGMGRASTKPDTSRYDKRYRHCDVLIIGGGVAGLTAALDAAETGADVVLVEQDCELGGQAIGESGNIGEQPLRDWLIETVDRARRHPGIEVLTRTSAFGDYDGRMLGLVERLPIAENPPQSGPPLERLWIVAADQVVFATGAVERSLVFSNNDLPGVMLAGAATSLVARYAVCPGKNAVVFTNNDSVYDRLAAWRDVGMCIHAIVDCRARIPETARALADKAGVSVLTGHVVTQAKGWLRVTGVRISAFDGKILSGATRDMRCDLVLVSGGWSPAVHLTSHRGAKPVFNAGLNAFLPGDLDEGYHCCGALAGHWRAEAAIRDAHRIFAGDFGRSPEAAPGDSLSTFPIWEVPSPRCAKKKFVDLQHDVTSADIHLAHREGFTSVEHLKRYTTLGMATDQGKTSNLHGLAIMAKDRMVSLEQMGTTTYRPPYTPVSIGVLASHNRGLHFRPRRTTPLRSLDEAKCAPMNRIGLWERAWFYPAYHGETLQDAYIREAAHVRAHVGLCDISSLGKIDIQGPDAADFLNRIYTNNWLQLPVGKARYGLMLREDGIVMDDGTTARYGEQEYFMTTTTGNAEAVMTHLEFLLGTQWPDLRVNVTSVTDHWAGMSLAGPKSRALLRKLVDDISLANEDLPHMGARVGHLQGYPVRLNRLSFSGELAYEVFTPAGFGAAIWTLIERAGKDFSLGLYGTEALGALRIEKGHVSSPELDGRTTAQDLGLGALAGLRKPYVGSVLQQREGLVDPDRPSLVGLKPLDRKQRIRGGSLLFPRQVELTGHGEGHVSSTTFSPALGHYIALGFLRRGAMRTGENLLAVNPVDHECVHVEVVSPHFYDPEGERLHA